MIAIPAVDLRGGACVQLVGGSYSEERVRRDDAMEVAREWTFQGFRRLHLVDLDAATGRGSNEALVRRILDDATVPVQVGGGVRTTDRLEDLLEAGADWVIVGTRALEEPDWLGEVSSLYPGRLIVATDVRDRHVVTRGWGRTLPEHISDVVEDLNSFELGGLLVTAVHREGQLEGTDLPLMEDVAEASRFPVFASGGVSSIEEIRALQHRGVEGVVIGMALYTGAIDSRALVQEFG